MPVASWIALLVGVVVAVAMLVIGVATDRIVSDGLDDAVHQELVEAFIAKVGQS